MFERFTEKSIKVVMLAQEEARRLGHNFVGTEQILCALVGEGTGNAAHVLKSAGVSLKRARIEVEKIIGRGSGFVAVEIPFTPRTKRVLELSLQEARYLGHNHIGTEHLLIGLLQEGEGVASRVLENMGVNLAQLLEQIRSTAQQSPEPPSSLPRTLSSSASRVRPLIEELSNPIFRFVEPVAAIVAARFSAALYRWVEPRRLGHVLNSPSLRLVLNEDDYLTLTPNVAFIGHGQLDQHPFQDVIPELAAVVLCGPEPSAKQTRLEILMEYGVKVGLLLDPQLQTVSVYCGEDDRQILQGQDTLRLHELFPGWEVPISEFWPPLAETQSES